MWGHIKLCDVNFTGKNEDSRTFLSTKRFDSFAYFSLHYYSPTLLSFHIFFPTFYFLLQPPRFKLTDMEKKTIRNNVGGGCPQVRDCFQTNLPKREGDKTVRKPGYPFHRREAY